MTQALHEQHEKMVAHANAYIAHNGGPPAVREAVGIFETVAEMQDAIRTLEGSAFPRQDISVMGKKDEMEKVFGDGILDLLEAAADPYTPRRAPVRPEEETIGTSALIGGSAYVGAMAAALTAGALALPASLAGAAVLGAAGGGTIGAVLSKILGDHYSEDIETQIEEGGVLLWVRTPDTRKEELATTILRRHRARHVHIQTLH